MMQLLAAMTELSEVGTQHAANARNLTVLKSQIVYSCVLATSLNEAAQAMGSTTGLDHPTLLHQKSWQLPCSQISVQSLRVEKVIKQKTIPQHDLNALPSNALRI